MQESLTACIHRNSKNSGILRVTSLVLPAVVSMFTLFATGCGGSNSPTHTLSDIASVSEQSFCEAMNPTFCTGAFGFAVDSQGNFTAGPSRAGKVVQGKITSDELATFQSLLSMQLGASGNGSTCSAIPLIAGVGDTIKATFTNNTQTNLFSDGGGQQCFLGNTATGTQFRDFFHQLLAKYYPIPFPS